MNRSALVHAVRERLARYPEPFESHYGVVPSPPPREPIPVTSVRQRHAAALTALGRAQVLANGLNTVLLSRLLPRDEAVRSSAMEGTHSTLDALLTVEVADEGVAPDRQVHDYAETIETLLPTITKPGDITLDAIFRAHEGIMRNDPDFSDPPGQVRPVVVWVGGGGDISRSIWNPPPPDDTLACLNDTVEYIRDDGEVVMHQDIVTRIAVAHAHFEAVHPFRDGNGRIGRMLMTLMLKAEVQVPLYLSPYIDANKADYIAALKAAQQRLEWHEIIGFISDAIVATVGQVEVTQGALVGLRASWSRRRPFRKNSGAMRSLDLLTQYPVLTTKRLATLLDLSLPQANVAMDHLVDAGIMTERTGYRRNRIFVAHEVLNIINRPFGDPI